MFQNANSFYFGCYDSDVLHFSDFALTSARASILDSYIVSTKRFHQSVPVQTADMMLPPKYLSGVDYILGRDNAHSLEAFLVQACCASRATQYCTKRAIGGIFQQ